MTKQQDPNAWLRSQLDAATHVEREPEPVPSVPVYPTAADFGNPAYGTTGTPVGDVAEPFTVAGSRHREPSDMNDVIREAGRVQRQRRYGW